jgi:hypothetical protein
MEELISGGRWTSTAWCWTSRAGSAERKCGQADLQAPPSRPQGQAAPADHGRAEELRRGVAQAPAGGPAPEQPLPEQPSGELASARSPLGAANTAAQIGRAGQAVLSPQHGLWPFPLSPAPDNGRRVPPAPRPRLFGSGGGRPAPKRHPGPAVPPVTRPSSPSHQTTCNPPSPFPTSRRRT